MKSLAGSEITLCSIITLRYKNKNNNLQTVNTTLTQHLFPFAYCMYILNFHFGKALWKRQNSAKPLQLRKQSFSSAWVLFYLNGKRVAALFSSLDSMKYGQHSLTSKNNLKCSNSNKILKTLPVISHWWVRMFIFLFPVCRLYFFYS